MSQLRSVARIALIAAAFLIAPRPAAAGRLQDCCSKQNAFCIIPYAPGAAACNAAGGMFFAANACTKATKECGVVHQRTATGTVSLQTQPSGQSETIPVQGHIDVIETEMIQLELTGVGPIGPIKVHQSVRPSPGSLGPGTSSYDLNYDIERPVSNPVPQHVEATGVTTFPPDGIPYNSTGAVPLHDEVMQLRLATFRYRQNASRTQLGFIIDDAEPSPSIDPARDMVDLYAYTSMAVAALQTQAHEIEALRNEVRSLRRELEGRGVR